jgi:hypothetical protein
MCYIGFGGAIILKTETLSTIKKTLIIGQEHLFFFLFVPTY